MRIFGGILVALSWAAAIVVGLYVEYRGWDLVIGDRRVLAGLLVAMFAGPAAFMLTQRVIGGLGGVLVNAGNDKAPPSRS